MSDAQGGLLHSLSRELEELAERIVPSTAIVTGQLRDFSEASGSGWLYDRVHLVTNFHVVDGLEEPVHVRMPGHPHIEVTVVGMDSLTDLAVLALPEPTAEPLAVRDREPSLGELCFAFGSPLGQYPESMTLGIVSGLHRRIDSPGGRTIEDVVQTDAAINHGNSGGPLVDVGGYVIGVNDAGIDDADNIGFAIPAATVNDIVPELLKHSSIVRASLGLSVATRVVEFKDRQEERPVVTTVRSSTTGPFKPGDVLLRIGDRDVHRRGDLFRILRRDLIDQDVPVEVWRDGQPAILECRPRKMDT